MELEKKTIAINSFYLYISSFFQLIVGLYTSRALLQALGVEDFGIYGVVGGIIGLLSFVNMAMSSASSRYLTFELANGTIDSQKRVFSVVFIVHVVIAILTLVLGETIGLWYVANKLVVPEGRIYAAHWVYQAAIFMSIINIIQVPYNASITAHEKMGFLSFWSSINIFLKLIVILLLYISVFDRLILYAILMLSVTALIALGYFIYCRRKFDECFVVKVQDAKLFKDVLSFAGFSAFTSFASALRTQGANLLINRFFGVVLNAAGSVSTMVSGYIISFTSNIITAFRPQIVKSYAVQDYDKMSDYIKLCMSCCLGMFTMIAVPIFLEMDYVLTLWLGIVPQYAVEFCQISLVGAMFGLLNMTALIAIQATSHVKMNSIYISIASLLSVAILFICFHLGSKPYSAYIIYSATELVILALSIWNAKKLIPELTIISILSGIARIFLIILLSGAVAWWLTCLQGASLFRFFLVILVYNLLFCLSFFFFILTKDVRQQIIVYSKSRFGK